MMSKTNDIEDIIIDEDNQNNEEVLLEDTDHENVNINVANDKNNDNQDKIIMQKIVSLNCNGINETQKRGIILKDVIDQKPDFAVLIDTRIIDNISNHKTLVRTENYHFEICGAVAGERGPEKGIIMLVKNSNNISITNVIKDPNGQYIILEALHELRPLLIVGVYGPSDTDDPDFWTVLIEKIELLSYENYVLIGDVNFVLDVELDTLNYASERNRKPKTANFFKNLISEGRIIDAYRHLQPDGRDLSWRRWNLKKNAATSQRSRIDIPFTSSHFVSYIEKVQYIELEHKRYLDHKLLSVEFCYEKFKKGPGTFRCPPKLHLNHDYCETMKEVIRQTIVDHVDHEKLTAEHVATLTDQNLADLPSTANPETLLEVLLFRLKDETSKFVALKNTKKNQLKKDLLSKLHSAKNNFEQLPTEENGRCMDDAQTNLDIFYDNQERLDRQKVRSSWIRGGDKPSSWYLNLQKARSASNGIAKLKVPIIHPNGQTKLDPQGNVCYDEITKQKLIIENIGDSYSRIFKKRPQKLNPCPYITLADFLSDRNTRDIPDYPKLSPETRNNLESDLTLTELGKALKNLNNGSSPGIDGFCAGWLKCFWPILGKFLFNAIMTSKNKENPEMSPVMRMALITLIPKGDKDRSLLGNWRPISLLSIFYKVLSAALAERLKFALQEVIHEGQKAYLPGRFIGSAVKSIHDAQYWTKRKKVHALLIMVDFSKAFDSIEHDYIWQALESFGFGPKYISWIQLIFKNREACITLCGHSTKRFTLGRGIPQGDCISGYIFLAAIEFLAISMRSAPGLGKISINQKSHIAQLYADDMTCLLLRTESNIRNFLKIMEDFRLASGLAMNASKTALVNTGIDLDQPKLCPDLTDLQWPDSFRLLGIEFTKFYEDYTDNYELPLKAINREMNKWEYRLPSPLGRAGIIKTCLLSKLTHMPISLSLIHI